MLGVDLLMKSLLRELQTGRPPLDFDQPEVVPFAKVAIPFRYVRRFLVASFSLPSIAIFLPRSKIRARSSL